MSSRTPIAIGQVLKAPIRKRVRTMGLRRSRSIGLRKTHLGHVALAAAVNLIQLMSWLRGEAPEQTRTSAFKRVMEQAA
jgi:transposase